MSDETTAASNVAGYAGLLGVASLFLYRAWRMLRGDKTSDDIVNGLRSELATERQHNNHLRESIDRVAKERNQAVQEIGALEATVKFQTEKIEELDASNKRLTAQVQELSRHNEELTKSIDQLKTMLQGFIDHQG